MKYIERFKHRVVRRSGSSARPELNEASPDSGPTGPANPSQSQAYEKYGLFEFKLDESRPRPEGPEQFPVDIIAVHGLNGDAYSTWTHPGTGKLWLRDFIPEFLPGSRVYTFGYPSKLMDTDMRARVQEFGWKLTSSIRDHLEDSTKPNRPIIFVCHSLGGIVCKQALVYAHEDEKTYGSMLEYTRGIVFLATPHRGSDTADFAKVVSMIVSTCMAVGTGGLRPSVARTELLEYLGRNSNALQDLLVSVRHRLQNLSVVTFYENKVMPSLPSLIVDRASAELGLFNEDAIPLWEDHRTICRFESDTSPSYLDVARALRRIARKPPFASPTLHRASTHSSNKIYNDAETTCVKLLSDFNVVQHEQTPPKPVAGTCQWIRAHQSFVSWLENGSNALLWLTGQAGCGKTTLSYSLAQYFSEIGERSRTVLVYFCQNRNNQTDAKAVLIGLILQIIGRHRSMVDHVRKMYDLQRQSIVRSFALLWNLFLSILQDPKSGAVYVIVDALDECEKESCRQLLNSISDMLSSPTSSNHQSLRVKFLLTSRPFLHQSYVGKKQALQPQISIDDNQPGYADDIRMFIQERVDEISQNRQFPTHIRDYLYQSMILKADQTFLWIQVVLASLEKSLLTSKTDLQNIISGIPKDLADTYMRYMVTIPSEHQDEASRLLKLLLSSSRPLHLDELNIAFTLKTSHNTAEDVANDLQNAISHTVQGILGPLVRVSTSQVSLVHHSVKEFLLKQATTEHGESPDTRTVNVQNSAMELARACIKYLLLDDFQVDQFSAQASEDILDISDTIGDLSSDDITGNFWDDEDHSFRIDALYDGLLLHSDICESIGARYPFYTYAALHWAEHFAVCEDTAPSEVRIAAKLLMDVDTAYCRNWLSFYRTRAVVPLDDDAFGQDRVVLASQFNSDTILQELLSHCEVSQATKNRSLYWASRLGHDRIVASTLRAGANPNSKELERQTALTSACEQGNLSCVRSLLADRQTDINMPGRNGRTALSFACGGGYNDIVKHLLSYQACNEHAPDYSGATPFLWAAEGGHQSTMLMLTRCRNVDINHRDKLGRTAVSWAAGDGKPDVLNALLKFSDLDVNITDNKGRSPLSWAAGNGQVDTIELLLSNASVNVKSSDNDKRNAVSWACAGGHIKVVEKLLDRKCPGVDAEDIDGWTPLAWAIQTDSPDTVQALIDSKQVQIEKRDRNGRTVLSWAIAYGHTRVINILLRAGAIPNT
ncbi:hypothetical protein N3K66_005361 [Trichothecium roseum]|uniref:Uncharacterized protein n=1 Tax=Trichothecium roseum TaxID=47278 RepID=A0ACC0UYD0_9HYPO|nr:hypothetical protein N3K66_005361 [Trichothecium roseum]